MSFIYYETYCGRAEIGRQAWLRAVWASLMRVRISPTAPNSKILIDPVWFFNAY